MADPAHSPRRELQPSSLALHIAGLLQHVGDLAQLVQRLASLGSEELLREGAVDIVGAEASPLQLRLEPIHLLQPLHELHGLAHAQRVLAEERIALAQLGRRHHRLHEAGQAR